MSQGTQVIRDDAKWASWRRAQCLRVECLRVQCLRVQCLRVQCLHGVLAMAILAICGNGATSGELSLACRSRVQPVKGVDEWTAVEVQVPLAPATTALVLCDVWDRHWCDGATQRCAVLAGRMAPLVEAARAAGVLIVHAPSDTLSFYQDHPARRRAQAAPRVAAPASAKIFEPALPIDDSDGGCDGPHALPVNTRVWTRQHPAIRVADEDLISDDGQEIYNSLSARGVRQLIVMGVHTNMCVLGRSFGIRQMTRWGLRTLLVRDLTDAMYNPQRRPHVSHDEGTALVVEHIEKYWCPSTTSAQLLSGLTAR